MSEKVNFKLGYGDSFKELSFPRENLLGVLTSKDIEKNQSEKEIIIEALENPIDSPLLSEIVSPGEKIVIVINDITRLWVRHHAFMPYILEELTKAGVKDEDVLIISATGAHREQTEDEWRELVGEAVFNRIKIMDHRSTSSDEMVNLGKTDYGTPIEVNKEVLEADRVIITSGIVYHFLAGYGGGKKAVMPGVCSYDSIMANHKLALNPKGKGLNPEVKAGKLDNNPISEDMLQVVSKVGVDFALNVVIDEEKHEIAYATAGEMEKSHRKGAEFVDKYFGIKIEEQADLVIASCGGYPKDIELYQTYKTVHNIVPALKPGGVGILLTECREGVGNEKFYTIFTEHEDNEARENFLREKYNIAGFMGFSQAIWAEEYTFIIISSLPDEKIKNMNMIPAKDLDQALELAKEFLPDDYKAYVMPTGAVTYPLY